MKLAYEESKEYLKIVDTEDETFKFFWETASPFSQWHESPFQINGIEFQTAEHYMMYQKALLFEDYDIAQQILTTTIPREVKALGKKVKGYSDKKWYAHRLQIVYDGNKAKFEQDHKLMDALLDTKGKTLVEASPYDRIWGIGLAKEDDLAQKRETWKGENLLGKVLTELRYQIIGEF